MEGKEQADHILRPVRERQGLGAALQDADRGGKAGPGRLDLVRIDLDRRHPGAGFVQLCADRAGARPDIDDGHVPDVQKTGKAVDMSHAGVCSPFARQDNATVSVIV